MNLPSGTKKDFNCHQETSRLRSKAHNVSDTLGSVEIDLRTCRENLDRALADKECLQRQSAAQVGFLDFLLIKS